MMTVVSSLPQEMAKPTPVFAISTPSFLLHLPSGCESDEVTDHVHPIADVPNSA